MRKHTFTLETIFTKVRLQRETYYTMQRVTNNLLFLLDSFRVIIYGVLTSIISENEIILLVSHFYKSKVRMGQEEGIVDPLSLFVPTHNENFYQNIINLNIIIT